MQETQVQSLGWEDPLEKGIITIPVGLSRRHWWHFGGWRGLLTGRRPRKLSCSPQALDLVGGGVQGAGQLSPERESAQAPQRDRPRGQLF